MTITNDDNITRTFFTGFIRLHILHHAGEAPLFGLDMIRELARHGYELSPGTLYPILHGLERDGYLVSHKEVVDGKARKLYVLTKAGQKALVRSTKKVRELMNEISTD
jgi:DNA-binding PadR family transcriptional regulator